MSGQSASSASTQIEVYYADNVSVPKIQELRRYAASKGVVVVVTNQRPVPLQTLAKVQGKLPCVFFAIQ